MQYLTPWWLAASTILIKLHYFYFCYIPLYCISHTEFQFQHLSKELTLSFQEYQNWRKNSQWVQKIKTNSSMMCWSENVIIILKVTSLYLHDLLHTLKSLKHWNYITVIHNWIKRLNPVSPTSDQNQFSSNNIIT